jgi:hypothetical protein
MFALGEIDINTQKNRSGSYQGGGVYAPTLPTTSASSAPMTAEDQKRRTAAGPGEPTPLPIVDEEGIPLTLTEKIKKYAPYAIAAVVVYYFITKK